MRLDGNVNVDRQGRTGSDATVSEAHTYGGKTLADLRALHERATAPPWTTERPKRSGDTWPRGVIVAATAPRQGIYADPSGGTFPAADQDAIAAFRNAVPDLLAHIEELQAALERLTPKEHDGRSISEAAPHAAYCDVALQDCQIQVVDNGEVIWFYDDALFDKSLAGNGYKVVPVTEASDHDRRVTELLEANNREVERRRIAETKLQNLIAGLSS